MRAAMDLMITYMAAVPFNYNDIFKEQLNSTAVIIVPNKTIAYYCPKRTQIKTKLPLTYQQLSIIQ